MLGLVAVALMAPGRLAGASETLLHSFQGQRFPNGSNPLAGLVVDAKGNFYGTTAGGGAQNFGVVYRVSPSGHETVLHSFTGPDGSSPGTGVTLDAAGNIYGTTGLGGSAGVGVVFKVDTAGKETVLYSFKGGADGKSPLAGVILDSAGNLYGTTYTGGTANMGVIYKVDPTGHESVLYNFSGGNDGGYPRAGLVFDGSGNLYGTTSRGGLYNSGVAFKLDAAGHETALYSFSGGADGGYPYAGVILDSAGNLYGTTFNGGAAGYGVVFKLDAAGHESVLYSFKGGSDGEYPQAGVIRDSAGNLYGTTIYGGNSHGVVYKVDSTGHETVLYRFTQGADGGKPYAGLWRDSAGNLYGSTDLGGAASGGVVYKLDTTGHETPLYTFTGASGGNGPQAGLASDGAGNFYGTTSSGGLANTGTVYKLNATGQEAVLYSFKGGTDGAVPYAGVVRDGAGNLYGTTYYGGAMNLGTVYKVGGTGQESLLHSFAGSDGQYPFAGVTLDPAGNLYGTTYQGGSGNSGVIYKLGTTGQYTVLYNFSGGGDGGHPYGSVARDAAGNLYGTTTDGGSGAGVVYKLDTTGHYTVLWSFSGGGDGGSPYAGVSFDPAGNLYGTTYYGGAANAGVVYKIDTAGQESVLYSFSGGADGKNPYSGVAIDPAGNLYGTTEYGGAGYGVVYKLDTTMQATVLHAFAGGSDGTYPYAGVLLDSSGNLYGTTLSGGKHAGGVIFKITP